MAQATASAREGVDRLRGGEEEDISGGRELGNSGLTWQRRSHGLQAGGEAGVIAETKRVIAETKRLPQATSRLHMRRREVADRRLTVDHV